MGTTVQGSVAFATAARAAGRLLDGEPDLTVFSTWALAFVRGHADGAARHAALDGLLAALDSHERDRATVHG